MMEHFAQDVELARIEAENRRLRGELQPCPQGTGGGVGGPGGLHVRETVSQAYRPGAKKKTGG